LTPEERRFLEETFEVAHAFKATIGMPVDAAAEPNPRRFRDKYKIQGPFLLYAGRLDPSKGCDDLLRFYLAGRRHLPPATPLIHIGSRVMGTPRDPQIRYLGMLPEQDKLDAMAAASIVINPSPFESFSIVTLEAMSCGTPVLVNGRSEVLKGHVQRSSGGLYYETYFEFVEAIRWMLDDHALRSRLGGNGVEYVKRNYSRENVKRRYMALFERVGKAARKE
jgi:glycosyltransferase involved in cell wall biosynthesis